ncbi:MAG: sodium-dependent transporter [Lachnospiraceae bacterium]|jgi:NSS family neurotransmitter:Na+ symporter|nr:sodium-dependent transporter [Lachnospiraceae bacterium]
MKSTNKWASKMGFILATAGAAIGLGNLWKFPYLMGRNGGFPFLAAYLIFIGLLGIPVMITEMSLGRKTGHNPVLAYDSVHPHARIVGYFGVLAAFFILSYYAVIGGWIIKYFFSYTLTARAPEDFSAFIGHPTEPLIWFFLFMLSTALICYFGVSGIEKTSKFMMPALFVILLIIIVRGLTLPGAAAGLSFVLTPKLNDFSIHSVSAALGQVFYSLSLCMGITITYGSYLHKDVSIPKGCIQIAVLDTCMAVLAGIAIFPAVFACGLEPASGPGLIFVTLPEVFSAMAGGPLFAALFFLLVLFAALTSAVALLEVSVSFVIGSWHWSRRKAVVLLSVAIFLIGIPSSLSFGPLAGISILNYNIFDFVCMLTDNIFLPFGGIFMCYYIGWKWNPALLIDEIRLNDVPFPFAGAWLFLIRFVTPIMVIIVSFTGFFSIYQTIFP